ncbi:MAG: ParB/RepB/Spo0J family partition protein [Gemmatimonadetes bacterium]|nr:ParB/RepB/Spo0J family partition protein [Gemmatimonadota bacterium]
MTETKRLGRGLEALLGPVSREQADASGTLRELPIAQVRPNPYQPRTRIDEPALAELAQSMEASGLLQPVVVRSQGGAYELIAGERRWRAAQRLGWSKIPAVVKDVDDRTLLTLALIENLQRDDLSPIDEAAGYQRLGEEFHLGHAEIARAVGRDRSTVANLLRLLQLPDEVQAMLHEGRLSEGHGRALLGVSDGERQVALARQAVEQGWSVREVEAVVAGQRTRTKAGRRPASTTKPATADVKRVEDALRKRLGTDVRVTARRRGRGLVTISYYSNDDLARLLEQILGSPFEG